MTQFGEKCKKIFFALLNIVGLIVVFIVAFTNTTTNSTMNSTLDTLLTTDRIVCMYIVCSGQHWKSILKYHQATNAKRLVSQLGRLNDPFILCVQFRSSVYLSRYLKIPSFCHWTMVELTVFQSFRFTLILPGSIWKDKTIIEI